MKIITSLNRASALLRPEHAAACAAATSAYRNTSMGEIACDSLPLIAHDLQNPGTQASPSRPTIPQIASCLLPGKRRPGYTLNINYLSSSEEINNALITRFLHLRQVFGAS